MKILERWRAPLLKHWQKLRKDEKEKKKVPKEAKNQSWGFEIVEKHEEWLRHAAAAEAVAIVDDVVAAVILGTLVVVDSAVVEDGEAVADSTAETGGTDEVALLSPVSRFVSRVEAN